MTTDELNEKIIELENEVSKYKIRARNYKEALINSNIVQHIFPAVYAEMRTDDCYKSDDWRERVVDEAFAFTTIITNRLFEKNPSDDELEHQI